MYIVWVVVTKVEMLFLMNVTHKVTLSSGGREVVGNVCSVFPHLLETLEKPGIYFGSLNPGISLEFCVKTLNSLEMCERHTKMNQHISFFL